MSCSKLLCMAYIMILISSSKGGHYRVTDQIYFELEHGGRFLGRMVMGLFGEIVPKTVANFKQIATNGINGSTYEGTRIHTVVRKFMIQGGDIINNNGSGAISIYGKFFNDENYVVQHNAPGIISMANAGRNSNGCQFFITTVGTPGLNGKYVAFGRVVKGQEIVHRIEHMGTDSDDHPIEDVVIIRSGILNLKTPLYESDEPYELTLWAWLKAGWFPLSFSFAILFFFHWLMMQLNSLKSFQ